MAAIVINISGDTIAGMNDKMSAANGCYLTWKEEKITSTGKNISIPVTESGTLGLPEGQASGVYYSYTMEGDTTLSGDEILTVNYTAEALNADDKGGADYINITYNSPASGNMGGDISVDLTTLELRAGTYTASALANAARQIASALSKEIQYEVVQKEYKVTLNETTPYYPQGCNVVDGYDTDMDYDSGTAYSGGDIVTITSGYISINV